MDIGSISSSGIQAALSNMESISNNIANVNTVGYKKSYVNFSDIFTGNGGNDFRQIGMGARVHSVGHDFSTGTIQSSGRGLDLALSRDGFFIQKDPVTGLVSYTRAGRFDFDKDNNLIGNNGILQGFPAYNGVVASSGNLVNLTIPTAGIPPVSTKQVNFSINLDAKNDVITAPFNMNDPATYNYSSTETIYDSLGNSSLVSLYYVKNANNSWTANVVMGNQVIGTGSLDFDANGSMVSNSGLSHLSWDPGNGAATPQLFNVNLTGSTQYQNDNRVSSSSQDGCPSGMPLGCAIDNNGYLNVYYSNGINRVQGQIALAQFRAPQGLEKGDNLSWLPTTNSGSPMVNQDISFGAFLVNSLESSNVDLTEELVKLISAQHDFQANAQVQQTYNQVMQTIEKL